MAQHCCACSAGAAERQREVYIVVTHETQSEYVRWTRTPTVYCSPTNNRFRTALQRDLTSESINNSTQFILDLPSNRSAVLKGRQQCIYDYIAAALDSEYEWNACIGESGKKRASSTRAETIFLENTAYTTTHQTNYREGSRTPERQGRDCPAWSPRIP